MATVVSATGDYTPCPSGLHQACCYDVHDLGLVETQFGMKHKVALIWGIDEMDEKGKPHEARKVFTMSLNKKSTLRADLESWRGRQFTANELLGFDLDVLIGVQAQINVVHVAKGDKTYANVTAVLPGAKGQKLAVPTGYVRRKDREPAPVAPERVVPDDDVPFAWLLPMLLPITLLGGLVA